MWKCKKERKKCEAHTDLQNCKWTNMGIVLALALYRGMWLCYVRTRRRHIWLTQKRSFARREYSCARRAFVEFARVVCHCPCHAMWWIFWIVHEYNNKSTRRTMDNGWKSCRANVCKLVVIIVFDSNSIEFFIVFHSLGVSRLLFRLFACHFDVLGYENVRRVLNLLKFNLWNVWCFERKCSFGMANCLCKMACKLFLLF